MQETSITKGLSKDSCSVDLIDIKNTIPKHQQTCSKIQKHTSGGHYRIHYKTCPSHTRTALTILSDYKRSLCVFRQDLLVCQESQFLSYLLFHAVLFLYLFNICACRCDPFCRFDKFALLLLFFRLSLKKCTYFEVKV